MFSNRLIPILLTGASAVAAENVVRKISYSDAVVVLTDRAIVQPRVEVVLQNGRKVKGRLLDVSSDAFSIKQQPRVRLCDAESVRVIGATASHRRIARGMVLGAIAGLFAASNLILATEPRSAPGVFAIGIGIPTVGGMAGAKLAEHGKDMVYVLQAQNPDGLCGGERGGN